MGEVMVWIAGLAAAIILFLLLRFIAWPFYWRANADELRAKIEFLEENKFCINATDEERKIALVLYGCGEQNAENFKDTHYEAYTLSLSQLDYVEIGFLITARKNFKKIINKLLKAQKFGEYIFFQAALLALEAQVLQRATSRHLEKTEAFTLQSRALLLVWPCDPSLSLIERCEQIAAKPQPRRSALSDDVLKDRQ